jgi:hypothetical protein
VSYHLELEVIILSLTADLCSLLGVTVVTSFCADFCKYLFLFGKGGDFMSFAFSGLLN